MTIIDIIAILVIVGIIGGAVVYMIRAKRKGQKCIGCPYCKSCNGNCSERPSSTEQ